MQKPVGPNNRIAEYIIENQQILSSDIELFVRLSPEYRLQSLLDIVTVIVV